MKNILALGCSWTIGHRIDYNQTWPYFLYTYLSEQFTDIHIYNAGKSGSSIEYCSSIIDDIGDDFDAVIIQCTTSDRNEYGINGILEKELRDISYTKRTKFYTEIMRDDLTEFQVNPGMAWSVNDRFNKNYQSDPYFDKIARTIKEHHVPDFDKKELLDLVRGWSTLHMHSKSQIRQYKDTVRSMSHKLKNKPHLFFNWLNNQPVTPDVNYIGNIQDTIDIDKFIIDDGFHLDEKGNNKVAEFLLDPVIRILSS